MIREATDNVFNHSLKQNETQRVGASLQTVPPEVLGEIFLRSLPKQCRPTTKQAPLLLCQISSVCRQVALSMPRLWNDLYISKDDFIPSSVHSHTPASVSMQWLSRAGMSSPLSLRLDYVDEVSTPPLIQDILIPFAHRYKKLILRGYSSMSNTGNSLKSVLELPPGHFNQLESLILSLDAESIRSPVTTFEAALSLRRVSLNYAMSSTEQSLIAIHLPWLQLTHLNITEFLLPLVWVNLMIRCPKLQKGAFNITMLHGEDPPPFGPEYTVTFLDLHDLGVACLEGRASYFNRFHFPSLTTFRLRNHPLGHSSGFVWGDSGHLLHQLRRLHRLSLVGHVGEPQDLLDLLRKTTSLVEFELDGFVNYSPVFRSLTHSLGQEILLSKLAEIALYLHPVVDTFSVEGFVRMVDTRGSAASGVVSLRRVSVYFTEACAMMMDEMKEKLGHHPGLSVNLKVIETSETLQANFFWDLGDWE